MTGFLTLLQTHWRMGLVVAMISIMATQHLYSGRLYDKLSLCKTEHLVLMSANQALAREIEIQNAGVMSLRKEADKRKQYQMVLRKKADGQAVMHESKAKRIARQSLPEGCARITQFINSYIDGSDRKAKQ